MSLSPMMGQYQSVKNKYPNTILMFRLGDFYEMFFDDAITVSRELDLTLTSRACGDKKRAPMCGVPHHAVQSYIARLIKKGYKVAICEQMEDPAQAKDIVAREVTRIVTGGTVTDAETLTEDKNNYLMSLYLDNDGVGAVWTDVSTSETYNYYIPCPIKVKLNDLLLRVAPSEIICNGKMLAESVELSSVKFGNVCPMSQYDDDKFELDGAKALLSGLMGERELRELLKTPACVCAEGALVSYVRSMQFTDKINVGVAESFETDGTLDIDANTAKTLELTESQSKKRGTTLRDVLNKTSTAMGDRLLQKWILRPLRVKNKIDERLDAVEALYKDTITREGLRSELSRVKDVLRIAANLAIGAIKPKDVLALNASLHALPDIKALLDRVDAPLIDRLDGEIELEPELTELIDRAIFVGDADKSKGKDDRESTVIRDGFDEKLDEYRALIRNSREIIAKMESEEREKTRIRNLKISYNRLFGYFIEVPRQQASSVPSEYERRQTVANAERYTTDGLKQLEYKILNASELADKREAELYSSVLATLRDNCAAFNKLGKALAALDALVALATVAKANGYVKPEIVESDELFIVEGRHPVAELLPSDELFVPNNTAVNGSDSKIMLITGPNMAGKSLYMRQVALITVLAHMGSFVPAKSARIGLVDKIFTRVGASDDLSSGRSTFMVEMSEVSTILANATDKSLVLLDEIGRGTSTYDGLSIAWAVIERLAQTTRAKILFSTHFHELTELEGTLDGIKNYKFTAKEQDDGIKFVRKIMRGSANKSFGIEVSALAGLPQSVIDRAKQILSQLINADIAHKANDSRQVSMFDNVSRYGEIIKILKELDTDNLTPKMAFDILCDIKEKAE